ncbi:hypothetical protein GMA11_08225 [Granulicatella sp. zg-ZJ]|uniref:hypothetical protein n=1 Tax=Granulicatella sp. zg-ZJ TaxID=2678504 RepID=UPI0013D429CA|nr:hypothetical protein [Granulicatella sp. zg-ZJ]NEW63363.1 hypothetical protein [Granulicatella sp. zg-ZJ]
MSSTIFTILKDFYKINDEAFLFGEEKEKVDFIKFCLILLLMQDVGNPFSEKGEDTFFDNKVIKKKYLPD